jgi:hypothetical protein
LATETTSLRLASISFRCASASKVNTYRIVDIVKILLLLVFFFLFLFGDRQLLVEPYFIVIDELDVLVHQLIDDVFEGFGRQTIRQKPVDFLV